MAFTEILPGIHYVGVNDRTTTRFESLWSLPYGVSYNSYLVIDEKVALIDTVEVSFGEQFIDNIRAILKDRPIDYLVVDHMEPDHSSSIKTLRLLYPEMQIVGNAKTLQMLDGYYGIHTLTREVKEGESISLGQKNLSFYMAPMVHWPEVMVTYCPEHKVLFSADAFGTFGALNGGILDSSFRWTISGTRCAATTPASSANTAFRYKRPCRRSAASISARSADARPRMAGADRRGRRAV